MCSKVPPFCLAHVVFFVCFFKSNFDSFFFLWVITVPGLDVSINIYKSSHTLCYWNGCWKRWCFQYTKSKYLSFFLSMITESSSLKDVIICCSGWKIDSASLMNLRCLSGVKFVARWIISTRLKRRCFRVHVFISFNIVIVIRDGFELKTIFNRWHMQLFKLLHLCRQACQLLIQNRWHHFPAFARYLIWTFLTQIAPKGQIITRMIAPLTLFHFPFIIYYCLFFYFNRSLVFWMLSFPVEMSTWTRQCQFYLSPCFG